MEWCDKTSNRTWLLRKEVEQYGVLQITQKGHDYLESPYEVKLAEERNYDDVDTGDTMVQTRKGQKKQTPSLDPCLLILERKLQIRKIFHLM